jgi:hypothetical protein
MKKLLIVFIILPFISIAQIDNCIITSHANHLYEWDYNDEEIRKYDDHKESITIEVYENYYNIEIDNMSQKVNWYYDSDTDEGNPIYFNQYYSKIVFNRIMNEIFIYSDYDREQEAYTNILVLSELTIKNK